VATSVSESMTADRAGSEKFRYLAFTAIVLVLDQITKYWVAAALQGDGEIVLVRGLVNLSYTENPGIAFGMLNSGNMKWLLIAISLAAIIVVIFYLSRTSPGNRILLVALALLAGGISGNLVDRIRMGRVIDFIEVFYRSYHWPVFNVADAAISIGAALLAIDLFLAPSAGRTTAPEPGESYSGEPPVAQ
jgi:signal peptidase II